MTSHRAIRGHYSAAFYSSGQQLEHGLFEFTNTMPQLLTYKTTGGAWFPIEPTESMLQLLFNSHENEWSMVFNSTNRDHGPAVSLFRVVLGRAYRGLTGGFLLLRNFSVAIFVSPHVCFILV